MLAETKWSQTWRNSYVYTPTWSIVLFILRLAFGGLTINRGWYVFMGHESLLSFSDVLPQIASVPHLAIAEIVCGAFIMIGLYTRWAAIPIIIEMLLILSAVAYGGTLALLGALFFLIPLVLILWRGPGSLSCDYYLLQQERDRARDFYNS